MKKMSGVFVILAVLIGLLIAMGAPVMADEQADDQPETLILDVTFRDFHGMNWTGDDGYSAHPDFEDGTGYDTGIVETTLGGDRKPVYTGEIDNPTTHGQAAFDQWYRDTAGVNQSLDSTLTFTLSSGNYVYSSSSFFPLDDQLLGNDGNSHNYHFTMELHSSFTYEAGQVFSFTGDDDVWVFIDNTLVIDLGGVHGAQSGSVELDTLGLTENETYDFDLFFAERHTTGSNFNATTNIDLQEPSSGVPWWVWLLVVLAVIVAGCFFLIFLLRRKKKRS
ncbi:fibro-slime domain-containing protein [Chloroflexota bacterium]